jgi:hypothetical protein
MDLYDVDSVYVHGHFTFKENVEDNIIDQFNKMGRYGRWYIDWSICKDPESEPETDFYILKYLAKENGVEKYHLVFQELKYLVSTILKNYTLNGYVYWKFYQMISTTEEYLGVVKVERINDKNYVFYKSFDDVFDLLLPIDPKQMTEMTDKYDDKYQQQLSDREYQFQIHNSGDEKVESPTKEEFLNCSFKDL